jgi:radical SAM/Cys-rich protein
MRQLNFRDTMKECGEDQLHSLDIRTYQVNLGLRCNQECRHCHHQAGPERTEMMSRKTMKLIMKSAKIQAVETIDITGGAPELHPDLKDFVRGITSNGHHLMVRTNLSALLEKDNKTLIDLYRQNKVEIIASLPCYEKEEADCVRGEGTFDRSITALQMLNSAGYGVSPDLILNLVYNPSGPFLPPPQNTLKEDYSRILWDDFRVQFTDLFTITNMPMGRFLSDLETNGKKEAYMDLLKESFNPSTLENLMCRTQINIGWDGTFYDCDFNQAIGLTAEENFPGNIKSLDGSRLPERIIRTDEHCFGCTAGAGSSCGGALIESLVMQE